MVTTRLRAVFRLPFFRRLRKTLSKPVSDFPEQGDDDAVRGVERYRRVVLSALGSFSSTAVSVVVTLISIPLTLNYLGAERFGIWMTIAASVSVFGFADLGIGNGLLNLAAAAQGEGDHRKIAKQISSAIVVIVLTGLALSAVFVMVYTQVDWAIFFNVSTPRAASEAAPTVLAFGLILFLGMPANLVAKTQIALQEGYISEVWKISGSLLRLIGVLLCVMTHASVTWLVIVTMISPILASAANGIHLFAFRRPSLRPSIALIDRATSLSLFRVGGLFFVLQTAVAVGYSSDSIVIARVLGAEAVPAYAIPMRLFGIVTMAVGFALGPMWPAYREALHRRDLRWTAIALRRSLIWTLSATAPLSLVLLFGGSRIVRFWVGDSVHVPVSVLLGLAIWTVLGALGSAIAMFLNAVGIVKFQVIVSSLMAAVNIILSVILTHTLGVAGAVWGSVLSYAFIVGIPYLVITPRLFRSLKDGTLQPM